MDLSRAELVKFTEVYWNPPKGDEEIDQIVECVLSLNESKRTKSVYKCSV